MKRLLLISVLWPLVLTTPVTAEPEAEAGDENPMAPFARLIGGEWHVESERMYHRFEWGIGQYTVISRTYAKGDDGDTLVSEGRWFWHPGQQAIKGYAVDNQGKSFMEMSTTFDGDKLINDLEWFQAGVDTVKFYRGVWEFTSEDHYDWHMLTETPDGPQKVMEASFDRKKD